MTHILNHNSISDFLKSELENRKRDNPAYSLRAFARDLCLSPSGLSEILKGKKGVSKPTQYKIADRMRLSELEKKDFLLIGDPQSRRSTNLIEKARLELDFVRTQKEITLEMFELVSEWYYISIREAFRNTHFRENPDELRLLLGITKQEFDRAVESLLRLNLIDESFKPTNLRITTPQDLPSTAIKRHHREILKKATAAINSQSVQEREFQSNHILISKENLRKIKQKIREFQNQIIEEFGVEEEKPQDVYCLSIQFFNLTKKSTGEGL
jgi:uncharacterized protein (TIGR02147 family)